MLEEKIEYIDNLPINVTMYNVEEYPMHYHEDDLEILVVMEGSLDLIDGQRVLHFEKDDIFIINDREVHYLHSLEPNSILCIQFDLSFFCRYNESFKYMFAIVDTYFEGEKNSVLVSELRNKVYKLANAYNEKKATWEKEILNISLSILTFIKDNFQYVFFRGYRNIINNLDLQSNRMNSVRFLKILSSIYEMYGEKLTLKQLAENEHISMQYLSQIIKDNAGITFQELQNLSRIQLSERFLLGTNMSVSELAAHSGFSATRYYLKYFEKWFGMSPEEYKASREKYLRVTPKMEIADWSNDFIKNIEPCTIISVDTNDLVATRSMKNEYILSFNELYSGEVWQMKMFENLDDRIKIGVTVALQSWRESASVLKRVAEFVYTQNISNIIYEVNDNIGINKHFEAIEYLIQLVRRNQINKKKTYFYISNELEGTNEKGIFQIMLKEVVDKFAASNIYIKEGKCGNPSVHGNKLIYDTLYGSTALINSLVKQETRKTYYNIFDSGSNFDLDSKEKKGLVTWNKLKKASYFAFLIYGMLGTEVVAETKDVIVTKYENGFQILIKGNEINKNHDIEKAERFTDLLPMTPDSREYIIELKNFRGLYKITKIKVNDSCDISSKVWDSELCDNLSSVDELLLYYSSFPEVTFDKVKADGIFNLHIRNTGFGYQLMLIEPIQS